MLLQSGCEMMRYTMATVCIAQNTDIARLYDNAAQRYDILDGSEIAIKLGLDGLRDDLAVKATGKVLEVGAGTGLQLSHYNWQQMRSLTAVNISKGMLYMSKEKAAKLPAEVTSKIDIQVGNVEQLSSLKDDEVLHKCLRLAN
jgi:ubiquinone/menaquinone biosynthesis C-methylase UbiE